MIYHLEVVSPDGDVTRNDLVARKKLDELLPQLDPSEGVLALSRNFGMGPALLTLTLYEKPIEEVFPLETGWKLIASEGEGGA